jgi:DNA-binding XRE family transcriptional regulator
MNDKSQWFDRMKNKVPPISGDEKHFWLCANDITEDKRDFREILKEAREVWNFTQREFAYSLGISIKHLNRIENCHQYPSYPLLFEMCTKLGYNIEFKFDLSKIPKS